MADIKHQAQTLVNGTKKRPGYTWSNGKWVKNPVTQTQTTTPTTPAPTTSQTPVDPANPPVGGIQVVPGVPQGGAASGQINVAELAGQLVTDPGLIVGQDNPATAVNESMELSDRVPTVSQGDIQAGTVTTDPTLDPSGANAALTQAGPAATATAPTPTAAAQVVTATTQEAVANAGMEGANGTLSDGSIIDPATVANGQLTAETKAALDKAAIQNMSNIIDTNTMAGKLLAEQLGEGNYLDSKATLKGQLDILQGEFYDPQGNPKIPAWAAGTARNVSKIAAFKGMTGTAATAAMAQALMEASIPIANADAQFFQTLTLENLSNRQEATINKANVLAKLDLQNMDAKLAVAVNNSQAFLKLDMANLENDQQAEVINTQARIQSILEDAKAENANRLFMADSQNDKDKFYASLEASIDQFNAAQQNTMSQFNAGEANDNSQFNSELENSREQFYKDMQFQIDTANAKWRQTVTLTENAQKFEAAATDVKNLVGISVEQLNQIWDRADALLDYAWKTADNALDRKNQLALVQLQGKLSNDAADAAGTGNILGSILGAGASALFGWLF